jgi:hypothetical protein
MNRKKKSNQTVNNAVVLPFENWGFARLKRPSWHKIPQAGVVWIYESVKEAM